MFTAGRYEYRNKGVDMFIEALARLNYQLQKSAPPSHSSSCPQRRTATRIEALKGQAITKQLRDTVTGIQNRIVEVKVTWKDARSVGVRGKTPGKRVVKNLSEKGRI
ncbi:glycogen synthase-domain-containing protein [Mycena galericulata]|nr:glycogen synthase-domain-containing protein [Mycena galericulata]